MSFDFVDLGAGLFQAGAGLRVSREHDASARGHGQGVAAHGLELGVGNLNELDASRKQGFAKWYGHQRRVNEGKVVVELKAADNIAPAHRAQLLTYMKLSDSRLGLLLNFGAARLKDGIVRMVK